MKRITRIISGLLIAWFVFHTALTITDGLTDDQVSVDIGVIFGNTVNKDGSLSYRFEKRLEKGLELYQKSRIKKIVVSGALGKEGYEEGTVMKDYLVSKGVPSDRIVVDNKGYTTEATAENLNHIALKSNSLLVISQYFHISRAKLALRKQGFEKVYGAHANCFEWRDFYSVIREFFGYYNYLFFKLYQVK